MHLLPARCFCCGSCTRVWCAGDFSCLATKKRTVETRLQHGAKLRRERIINPLDLAHGAADKAKHRPPAVLRSDSTVRAELARAVLRSQQAQSSERHFKGGPMVERRASGEWRSTWGSIVGEPSQPKEVAEEEEALNGAKAPLAPICLSEPVH